MSGFKRAGTPQPVDAVKRARCGIDITSWFVYVCLARGLVRSLQSKAVAASCKSILSSLQSGDSPIAVDCLPAPVGDARRMFPRTMLRYNMAAVSPIGHLK